jgi:large subunit ribosomal protein L18
MKLFKRVAQQRERRAFRVRNAVRASKRLRLSVFRSNKHLFAQIIDDSVGKTLVSAGTMEPGFRSAKSSGGNCAAAAGIGKLLAERALAAGISEVAFDRGQYRFHGRVAALAEAAREAGLSF